METKAPSTLEKAFDLADRAVVYAVGRVDATALRQAFPDDPRVNAWLNTKEVVQQAWTVAHARWNLGQWVEAGDLMQRALTEAGLLLREIDTAKNAAMRNAVTRAIIENTPLRFITEANEGVRAAQRALDDAGIPDADPFPFWKALAVVAVLGALAVWWKK